MSESIRFRDDFPPNDSWCEVEGAKFLRRSHFGLPSFFTCLRFRLILSIAGEFNTPFRTRGLTFFMEVFVPIRAGAALGGVYVWS